MQPTLSPERKRLLIIVGGVLVGVGLIVLAIVDTFKVVNTARHGTVTTTITKDPTSGESFVHQDGVVPESQVNKTSGPIFAGFGTLITSGLTSDQVSAAQRAFLLYKPFVGRNTKISLAVDDIHKNYPTSDDHEGHWSITTHVVVDQQTNYRVTLFYWGTSTVQLLLYDATGKSLLLDSGTVDSKG